MIDRSILIELLTPAAALAPSKPSLPILEYALINIEGGKITVTSTDLYVSRVDTRSIGSLGVETLRFAVQAKALLAAAKSMPAGPISLSMSSDYQLTLSAKRKKVKLSAVSGNDFPPVVTKDAELFATFESADLQRLISATIYGASPDLNRPHIAGFFLKLAGGGIAKAVTTDGHRMAMIDAPAVYAKEREAIIPIRGAREILKLEDDPAGVTVNIAGETISIETGDTVIYIRTVDEKYPPYEQVIPKRNYRKVILDAAGFSDALKRMASFSHEKSDSIELSFNPDESTITIAGQREGRSASDVFAAGSIEMPDKLTIGFNIRYLVEALDQAAQGGEGETAVELGGKLDPVIIRHGKYTALVMPMRI